MLFYLKKEEDGMNVIEVKVDDLKPYENNPRNNADSVQYVANSIKEFGFKVPIIVDRNNVIVAGHTRLLAAKLLGMETVPCIVADDLTDEQVRAFRIADNKVGEFSTWEQAMLDLELIEIGGAIDMSKFGFPLLEVEDEEKKKSASTLESMEIKAFEHWDYIVFVFDNQMDWLNVVNQFDLHKVNAGYGTTKKTGVGRVINGKKLLEAIRHQDSDIEQRKE